MVEQEEEVAQPAPEIRREEVDEAVGEIASMFSTGQESERGPGVVLRDGTVANAPELDSVEDLAVHGERRLSLGLLVAMVTVWSAIGAVVGTVLPPVPSGLWTDVNGLAWPVFGRALDPSTQHAVVRRNLGHHFDEIILRTCAGCMALGLV